MHAIYSTLDNQIHARQVGRLRKTRSPYKADGECSSDLSFATGYHHGVGELVVVVAALALKEDEGYGATEVYTKPLV